MTKATVIIFDKNSSANVSFKKSLITKTSRANGTKKRIDFAGINMLQSKQGHEIPKDINQIQKL